VPNRSLLINLLRNSLWQSNSVQKKSSNQNHNCKNKQLKRVLRNIIIQ